MSRSIACIDYRNGKVFIAKRQMKGDMGGRWEFPGGKIEENEDFETAIKWINRYKPTSKLLFSPMFNEDGTIAYPDLVDNLLALDLENWRVQIQVHKILNCK